MGILSELAEQAGTAIFGFSDHEASKAIVDGVWAIASDGRLAWVLSRAGLAIDWAEVARALRVRAVEVVDIGSADASPTIGDVLTIVDEVILNEPTVLIRSRELGCSTEVTPWALVGITGAIAARITTMYGLQAGVSDAASATQRDLAH